MVGLKIEGGTNVNITDSNFIRVTKDADRNDQTPAISLDRDSSINVKNTRISGFPVGIHSDGGHVQGDQVSFDGVRSSVVAEGGTVDARGFTSTQPSDGVRSGTSVGWTPPVGPRVPCCCPDCGTIFPSRAFSISSARFYIEKSTEMCPHCRRPNAVVSTGLFDIGVTTVKLLEGPQKTLDDLEALQRLAVQFLVGEISENEADHKALQIGADYGTLFNSIKQIGFTAVVVLSFILTLYVNGKVAYSDAVVWAGDFFSHTLLPTEINTDQGDGIADVEPHDKTQKKPSLE